MAIIMALLLKVFVVEAYKIPTGSMQPTLIGDERAGIKDRILVDKLSYSFREPRRWEVAVFRYPLNRAQNFVKRIVGVGPEEFRIQDGDLWQRPDSSADWRILRRPRSVQHATWKVLDELEPGTSSWQSDDPRVAWECRGRSIRARGPGRASFRGARESIVDRYYDGYPEALLAHLVPSHPRPHQDSGDHPVGDLRVDGAIRALPETKAFVIELKEGLRRYRFEIPGPAASPEACPAIEIALLGTLANGSLQRTAYGEQRYRLPAGRSVRFGAQNLDDLLELEIEGRVHVGLEIEATGDQSSAAFLELAGDGADLEDLMVYRDIYYLDKGLSRVTIPPGAFFMLGDNTQDSADGREWRFKRYRMGEQLLRGDARAGENPQVIGYGDPDGAKLFFRDEWGERHWMKLDEVDELPPEDAPFVPRELVLGRALAVFWPMDPLHRIFRLKWVR